MYSCWSKMISALSDKFGLIAGTSSDAWDTCDMKIDENKQLPVVQWGVKFHHKTWCLNWLAGVLFLAGLSYAGNGWSWQRDKILGEKCGNKSLSKCWCWGIGVLIIPRHSSCPCALCLLCFFLTSSGPAAPWMTTDPTPGTEILTLLCRWILRRVSLF